MWANGEHEGRTKPLEAAINMKTRDFIDRKQRLPLSIPGADGREFFNGVGHSRKFFAIT